jgi:Fe-S-cluster containining protein
LKYKEFLKIFDQRLSEYFSAQKEYIHCKKGCSLCCEKGDYHLSSLELEYLMQGYINIDNSLKKEIQENIKNMEKGGVCPFLVNKECSVYEYRPIICRVHGLSYLKNDIALVPYCVNSGLNYAKVYKNGEIGTEPIKENLDTPTVLKDFDYGEIRSLYDWLK